MKAIKLIGVYFVLFVFGMGITYFVLTKMNRKPAPIAPPGSLYQVIYQHSEDTEGRTVLYQNDDPAEAKYSGSGAKYVSASSPTRLSSLIGVFVKWEEIDGSKDRYLCLGDPGSNTALPKIRVAFEPSALFDGERNATALAVENLTTGEKENLRKQIRELTDEQVNDIIKTGDAIVVIPVYKPGEPDIKDDQGVICAGW